MTNLSTERCSARLSVDGGAAPRTRSRGLALGLLLALAMGLVGCGGSRVDRADARPSPASAAAPVQASVEAPTHATVEVRTEAEAAPVAPAHAVAPIAPAHAVAPVAPVVDRVPAAAPARPARRVDPAPLVYVDPPVRPVSQAALATLGAPPASAPRATGFFGAADAPVLLSMETEAITEATRGRGGRSLGFRLTFADGTSGYFKPDQEFNAMSWNAEIAAFHLDRALGLGRTAPVVSRRVAWEDLREAAGNDPRVDELHVDEQGELTGAVVWWVSSRPTPVELPDGWRRWLRVEGRAPSRISPYQTPGAIRDAVAANVATDSATSTPSPDRAERPSEMSDLIVFDYLTNNLDRWGGDNTNIRTVGPGGPLMFLDNAAGFTLRRPRNGTMDLRLHEVQRFRRSTIDAIRALDVAAFAERVNSDPAGEILEPLHVRNLATRRQHLLDHVDAMVEAHGEEAVYAW